MIKIIKRAQLLGYEIDIFYLYLNDPQMNINRVKTRVLGGGHNVPKVDIIRRFYRSKDLFWTSYRQLCDQWVLIYNSDEGFTEVAYGTTSNLITKDELLLNQFIKGIK